MRPNTTSISTKRPGWVFPSGLRPLVETLQSDLPQLTAVIDRHTRFPLFSQFLSPAESDALLEHHAGQAMNGVAGLVGVNNSSRGRMAMCPDCMTHDIKEHGYAFWRRLFLTPGVFACPVHERPLLTFCTSCEAGHRRNRSNWWPTGHCSCGDSLQVVAELDTKGLEGAIVIAKMAIEVLDGTAPAELSNATVCQAIRHSIGFAEGTYSQQRKQLAEALRQRIGDYLTHRLGIGVVTIDRLGGLANRFGNVRNPIQNLAAVYAVFGGFEGFVVNLQASESKLKSLALKKPTNAMVCTGSSREKSELSIENYIAQVDAFSPGEKWRLKIQCREWLLKLMIDNPGIKRSDLSRFPGNKTAIRYLKHIDSNWYDHQLPPRPKKCRIEEELRLIQQIQRLLEHIQHRYDQSCNTNPMIRVTKTYLLSNARCESKGSRAIRSEEVQGLLAAYIQAADQRRDRSRKFRTENSNESTFNTDGYKTAPSSHMNEHAGENNDISHACDC